MHARARIIRAPDCVFTLWWPARKTTTTTTTPTKLWRNASSGSFTVVFSQCGENADGLYAKLSARQLLPLRELYILKKQKKNSRSYRWEISCVICSCSDMAAKTPPRKHIKLMLHDVIITLLAHKLSARERLTGVWWSRSWFSHSHHFSLAVTVDQRRALCSHAASSVMFTCSKEKKHKLRIYFMFLCLLTKEVQFLSFHRPRVGH